MNSCAVCHNLTRTDYLSLELTSTTEQMSVIKISFLRRSFLLFNVLNCKMYYFKVVIFFKMLNIADIR